MKNTPGVFFGGLRGCGVVPEADGKRRVVRESAIRKVFVEKPSEFDPRKYMGPAREALAKLIASKIRDFGTAGYAGDYKLKTLAEMKAFYAKQK